MTKPQTSRLFIFVPSHSGKNVSLEKLCSAATMSIVVLFCVVTTVVSPAQNIGFTSLLSFGRTNGANPNAGLIQASDGNFYGTTYSGGANNNCNARCGTVFRITPAGVLTTLHSFCLLPHCFDGAGPDGRLVQGSDGNFYGTTTWGGIRSDGGTIFKITPSGTLTTLYTFCTQSGCPDGMNPESTLVQGADGNFYGTAFGGGGSGNQGTVFKVTPTGTLTTLYRFCPQPPGCPDGAGPREGLVLASDGNFYGTTLYGGGSGNCSAGCGTVFRITPDGELTTLYRFDSSDGADPDTVLVQASDGNFYGATYFGGANNDCGGTCGTVFRITPAGALTTLHSFDGSDGSHPYGPPRQAADGNFYGTTLAGGAYNYGTAFRITPSGSLTTLHSFDDSDGYEPSGGLVQNHLNGAFYGSTSFGGANGYGTVFRLGVVQPVRHAASE